jgi:hypothetical protein
VAIPSGGKADFSVPGKYWLFVRDDGQTRLVVRSGRLRLHRQGRSRREGRPGSDDRPGCEHRRLCRQAPKTRLRLRSHDRRATGGRPPAAAYELRDYGEWVNSSDYGYVWRPRVADDWSPYYYGRWVWVSPYGWTWVAYEPWGWYPYHFGWWASDPFFGWVWCPFRSFVSVNFFFGNFRFAISTGTPFSSRPTCVSCGTDAMCVLCHCAPGQRFVRSGSPAPIRGWPGSIGPWSADRSSSGRTGAGRAGGGNGILLKAIAARCR